MLDRPRQHWPRPASGLAAHSPGVMLAYGLALRLERELERLTLAAVLTALCSNLSISCSLSSIFISSSSDRRLNETKAIFIVFIWNSMSVMKFQLQGAAEEVVPGVQRRC